jgi:hypothetical protein
MVVATAVTGLILVVVYLCPWRIESTQKLQWSPIYQAPMSYVRSYDADHGRQGSSRIESAEAEIAWGILAMEVLMVFIAGGVLYVFFANSGDEEEPHQKH